MAETTTTKTYQINDEGDEYELVLLQDGVQVGGGVFPFFMGEDAAFELAKSLGESFINTK
jgi:hypothetical protein